MQQAQTFARSPGRGGIARGVTLALGGAMLLVASAGCGGPATEKKLSNPDPLGKVPAIKLAARTGDKRAAGQLVKDLENDDPAIRFYAIRALSRLANETFGYRYYDDEEKRGPAVKAWQAWLAKGQ